MPLSYGYNWCKKALVLLEAIAEAIALLFFKSEVSTPIVIPAGIAGIQMPWMAILDYATHFLAISS